MHGKRRTDLLYAVSDSCIKPAFNAKTGVVADETLQQQRCQSGVHDVLTAARSCTVAE